MNTPVLFTLALVIFYVGITLTFLNKEETRLAPLPALARTPIHHVSR